MVVVKDSSANKGGVITSSYEILAGMVVDDREFASIKDRYVGDVVARLRDLADAEARALVSAWRRRGGGQRLSELSKAFSEEIVRLSALFEPVVDEMLEERGFKDRWLTEVREHCAGVLADRFGDRLPVWCRALTWWRSSPSAWPRACSIKKA